MGYISKRLFKILPYLIADACVFSVAVCLTVLQRPVRSYSFECSVVDVAVFIFFKFLLVLAALRTRSDKLVCLLALFQLGGSGSLLAKMLLHWSADCSHIAEIKVSPKYQLLCSGWLQPLLEALSLLCGWMELYKLSARRKTAKERIPVEAALDERPSLLDTPLVEPEESVSESSYESDSSMDSMLSFTSCSSQLGTTYASSPVDLMFPTLSPMAPKSQYKGGGWLTPANDLVRSTSCPSNPEHSVATAEKAESAVDRGSSRFDPQSRGHILWPAPSRSSTT